jgi:hypothetical protein
VSGTAWLLLLFVVLPFVVAPFVVSYVAKRGPTLPAGHRTSELLESGEPAEAELIEWKNKGPFLFEGRPMIEFKITVRGEGDMTIVQSVPKPILTRLRQGMTLDVRLSADRTAGAIVLPDPD